METSKLVQKAKLLKLSSATLSENIRNGNFKSIFRGQGIEFSDVRDYLPGDNVRAIDWNVTARMGKPFIKQYEEDRELNVFFIFDCSISMYGRKLDTALETAALLLFAAENNSGAVGGVFFDGEIKFAISPKVGREHIMHLLTELGKVESGAYEKKRGSVLPNALTGAYKLLKKRSLVFVISDFRCAKWEKPFARLAQKNDVIALRITDRTDSELPSIGTIPFFDTESLKKAVFPTSSREFKRAWFEDNRNRTDIWREFCLKHGIAPVIMSTKDTPLLVLTKFFESRSRA